MVTDTTPDMRSHHRGVRHWLALVLVVISSLLVVASSVAAWAHLTLFNTDRFVAIVEPALDEPALYSALGDAVAEQTLEALDLDTRVANGLSQLDEFIVASLMEGLEVDPQVRDRLSTFERPSLAALAPAVTSALEARVERRVDELLTSEEFRQALPTLVGNIHQAAIALFRNDIADFPNVYVAEGEVRLNLIPIISDVLASVVDDFREFLPDVELPDRVSERVTEGRQQLQDALGAQLPDDVGQATLMSEDSFTEVQQTLRRLDQYVWLALALTLVAIIATIVVSTARRRTIIQLGAGIVIGLAVGIGFVAALQGAIVDEATTSDAQRVVERLLTATVSSLRTVTFLVGAVALVGALFAYLVGRRRHPAPDTVVEESGGEAGQQEEDD